MGRALRGVRAVSRVGSHCGGLMAEGEMLALKVTAWALKLSVQGLLKQTDRGNE